jgi:hypothetical protein
VISAALVLFRIRPVISCRYFCPANRIPPIRVSIGSSLSLPLSVSVVFFFSGEGRFLVSAPQIDTGGLRTTYWRPNQGLHGLYFRKKILGFQAQRLWFYHLLSPGPFRIKVSAKVRWGFTAAEHNRKWRTRPCRAPRRPRYGPSALASTLRTMSASSTASGAARRTPCSSSLTTASLGTSCFPVAWLWPVCPGQSSVTKGNGWDSGPTSCHSSRCVFCPLYSLAIAFIKL